MIWMFQLAAGSWSPSLLPSLSEHLVATGQCLATVRLEGEILEKYRNIPIMLAGDTNWYSFPPTEDGILKFAIHDIGLTNPIPSKAGEIVSTPRTSQTPGIQNQEVPQEFQRRLREGLEATFPELAKLPFNSTRVCW
jgi:sarcosine oxidase/L-pipecolate oxidase